MLTVLLVVIYIAFISLGLPDAILGSAWPMIYEEFGVSISAAGIANIIVCAGTILSSFWSGKMIKKFGTGKVTAGSVLLTAIALLGTYMAPNFLWICLLGIPMGIGAGAVDAALNNFVALHYEAKHMNWLHCFWGIGATAGPLVMSLYLAGPGGWRMGYGAIGIFQVLLVVGLLVALPLWNKFEGQSIDEPDQTHLDIGVKELLKLRGAKPALVGFFCYCAVELTTGLWVSSYLVVSKGVPAERAAGWVSLFYLGITLGRLVAGFLAMKFDNKQMIRMGQMICVIGTILLMLPMAIGQFLGILGIGLGCAPIYPAMLHETPNRFGKEISQGLMGIQMAVAYVGNLLVPPLFGVIAKATGFGILPYFLLGIVCVMWLTSERVNKVCETPMVTEEA
ncbi:MAG: MFS transporter [Cellulosilyticaceae bacterium]